MDKKELRKYAKQERSKLDIELVSKKLTEKICSLNAYKEAKNIMLYYPLPDEISLLCLLQDKTKNFYLPKIDGDNLLCCRYSEGDETCLSCYKTCEPLTEGCDKNIIDIIIVPALACDKDGYRLGYGGGFYDRFLADYKGLKIVCLPKELIFDTIYPQKHDVKMDIVISV